MDYYRLLEYLQDTIYPLMEDMQATQESIDAALSVVLQLLRFGVVIGFFALLWFLVSKFLHSLLYK